MERAHGAGLMVEVRTSGMERERGVLKMNAMVWGRGADCTAEELTGVKQNGRVSTACLLRRRRKFGRDGGCSTDGSGDIGRVYDSK